MVIQLYYFPAVLILICRFKGRILKKGYSKRNYVFVIVFAQSSLCIASQRRVDALIEEIDTTKPKTKCSIVLKIKNLKYVSEVNEYVP